MKLIASVNVLGVLGTHTICEESKILVAAEQGYVGISLGIDKNSPIPIRHSLLLTSEEDRLLGEALIAQTGVNNAEPK